MKAIQTLLSIFAISLLTNINVVSQKLNSDESTVVNLILSESTADSHLATVNEIVVYENTLLHFRSLFILHPIGGRVILLGDKLKEFAFIELTKLLENNYSYNCAPFWHTQMVELLNHETNDHFYNYQFYKFNPQVIHMFFD